MPSSSRLSSSDDDEEEKKNSYVPPSAPVGITFDTPIHPLSLTKEKEKDFPRLDTIHTLPPGLPALGQSLSRRQTLAVQTYPSRRGGTAATDFRTLSIQVYESQQPGGGNKKLSGDKEADVDFFSRVNFHLLPAMDVCQQFGVNSEKGLEENSAKNRLERNGRNVLVERKKRYWKKLLKYFFGGFCSILWIGVVSDDFDFGSWIIHLTYSSSASPLPHLRRSSSSSLGNPSETLQHLTTSPSPSSSSSSSSPKLFSPHSKIGPLKK